MENRLWSSWSFRFMMNQQDIVYSLKNEQNFIVFISNLAGNDHKNIMLSFSSHWIFDVGCWSFKESKFTKKFTLTSWIQNLYYRCRCSEKVPNDRRQWKHCIPVWSKMSNIPLRCPLIPPPLQIGNKWQQTHKFLYLPYFPLFRRQKEWMTNCKRLILMSKLKCVPAQLEEHTHSGYMGNNGLNLSSYQLNNIFSIKSRGSTAMKTKACPPKMSP